MNNNDYWWKTCATCYCWGISEEHRVVCRGCIHNPFAPCGANKEDKYIHFAEAKKDRSNKE